MLSPADPFGLYQHEQNIVDVAFSMRKNGRPPLSAKGRERLTASSQ